jgi:hypothetical protein
MDQFLKSIFPQALSPAVSRVAEILPASPFEPTTSSIGVIRHVLVENEWLNLAGRIYNSEPDQATVDAEAALVQAIISCVYTRSHDGYIREKHLRRILALKHPWAAPFLFQLVGEYVVEITRLIADTSTALLANESYRALIRDNPDFLSLIWTRAVSYENCYYRGLYIPKEDFPAFRFLSQCCLPSRSCQGTRPTCRSYCAHWRTRRVQQSER